MKEIQSISPSQISVLKGCSLRLLYYKQYEDHESVDHPSSVLGDVIHKMHEIASQKELDGDSFEEHWEVEIEKAKLTYFKNPLNQIYQPLEYWAPYYSIKKAQAGNRLLSKRGTDRDTKKAGTEFYSEERLDFEILTGKPDAVYIENHSCLLIDYKTGPVYQKIDNVIEIKDVYKDQLKAYGFLIKKTKNIKAENIKLILERINGEQTKPLTFSHLEYEDFYLKIKELVTQINTAVKEDQINNLGNPSESNCRYCLYKPKCKSFNRFLENNELPYALLINNPSGIEVTNNGVKLNTNYIWGISEEAKSIIQASKAKILLCNLSKSKSNNTYYWKKQSQIFEIGL